MHILRPIDARLNAITMYRTVLYALLILSAAALVLSAVGILAYGLDELLPSLIVLVLTCHLGNIMFAKLWKVPTNMESSLITALILFLILFPSSTTRDLGGIALTGLIAVGSKYLLAFRGKHVFNPVALAAVAVSFTGLASAVWWVGTPSLLPVTLVCGLLVVRKTRREVLFWSCVAWSFFIAIVLAITHGTPVLDMLRQHLLSWPIIFFASFMVTEPLTTPPLRRDQMIYGALVGGLSSWPLTVGIVSFTPELCLLIGNIYAYVRSMKHRLILTLLRADEVARDTFDYVWKPNYPVYFRPGQYLEWMLPHEKPDSRGVRRHFTIASSPTEPELHLGVKIMEKRSSYKEKLRHMKPGDTLLAGQLSGDFTLPKDPRTKLVFIAGGIGITPFRSMTKYLIDRNEKRNIILFYGNRTPKDIAYKEVFEEAASSGLRTLYFFNEQPKQGDTSYVVSSIDEATIRKEVPDFAERIFYISGPSIMVDIYKKMLGDMGVKRSHIVTDYFPGFA